MNIYSVNEFNESLIKHFEYSFQRENSDQIGLISVQGIVKNIRKTKTALRYKCSLVDLDTNTSCTILMPKNFVLKKNDEGRVLCVRGGISAYNFGNNLNISLNAVNAWWGDTENNNTKKEGNKNIKGIIPNFRSNVFDISFGGQGKREIAVIASSDSKALQDFMSQIKQNVPDYFWDRFVHFNVAVSNREAIINVLKQIKNNAQRYAAVVLLRGGGDESHFVLYDQEDLCAAWCDLPVYRIAGLGHTDDRHYVDLFSDYSADTPTAAGNHIASLIKKHSFLSGLAKNKNLTSNKKSSDHIESEPATERKVKIGALLQHGSIVVLCAAGIFALGCWLSDWVFNF